jgi:hypothetical protein
MSYRVWIEVEVEDDAEATEDANQFISRSFVVPTMSHAEVLIEDLAAHAESLLPTDTDE